MKFLLLALLLIAQPVSAAPLGIDGPSTRGAVWMANFWSHKLDKMRARHPGVRMEATGYSYQDQEQTITGIQIRVPGKSIYNPCWYIAVFSGDGRVEVASCSGN